MHAIARRSFAVLSTVSDRGFPHAAGVVYASVDDTLYVNTHRTSRKARNVAVDDRVAVVIPVRTLPVGPPFNVQFQGRAEVLAMDDPEITALLARGALKKITGHGELDEPDGCFLRIRPNRRIHSYGLGVSALAVARDPLHNGARTVERPPP
jgi:nitroimidazol reductase NimA-like FMN-containing flavoprotein (pyridoxamine 5'-phosphate oxidase superfamily)